MPRSSEETYESAPTTDRLTAAWFEQSRARTGISRQTWYHPAVEQLVESGLAGEPIGEPLAELAAARGSAGLEIGETLADLEAFLDVLPPARRQAIDHLSMAHCLEAWSEAFIGGMIAPSCNDSLTGLATVDFLRGRLSEVYRHCAALDMMPGAAYALVAIHALAPSSSPFIRMTDRIRIARTLRTHFPGGETIAMSDNGTALVLTSAGPDLDRRIDVIVATLRSEGSPGGEPTASVSALPEHQGDLADRLDTLTRPVNQRTR